MLVLVLAIGLALIGGGLFGWAGAGLGLIFGFVIGVLLAATLEV